MKKLFDKSDDEIGRPLYFDLDLYLDAVEHMIVADEIEFALTMLDRVPAWYRDNPSVRLLDIRSTVYQRLLTPHFYALDKHESEYEIDWADYERHGQYWPRPGLVKNFIVDSKCPVNVYEYSPGTYSIPKVLHTAGVEFGYKGFTINELALLKHKDLLNMHPLIDGAKNIFLCFETIEHLFDPEAHLKHWFLSCGVHFDAVFISTPLGTLLGGMPNWRTRELGHVRTYTSKDLMDLARRVAEGYQWSYVKTHMQIVVGQRGEPIPIRVDQY